MLNDIRDSGLQATGVQSAQAMLLLLMVMLMVMLMMLMVLVLLLLYQIGAHTRTYANKSPGEYSLSHTHGLIHNQNP